MRGNCLFVMVLTTKYKGFKSIVQHRLKIIQLTLEDEISVLTDTSLGKVILDPRGSNQGLRFCQLGSISIFPSVGGFLVLL